MTDYDKISKEKQNNKETKQQSKKEQKDTKTTQTISTKPNKATATKVEKKVIKAKPIKKGIFSRLGNALFGENSLRNAAHYVGTDIIIPSIKSIIVDSVVASVNSLIYGDTASSYNRNTRGYTNYSKAYSQQRPPANRYNKSIRAANRVQEFAFETRNDAAIVLDQLIEIATNYSVATVADYYDNIGATTEYTDNNYGWEEQDLRNVNIFASPNGYILSLPKPRALL